MSKNSRQNRLPLNVPYGWGGSLSATFISAPPIIYRVQNAIPAGGTTAEAWYLVASIAAHLLLPAPPTCFEEARRGIPRPKNDLGSSFAHVCVRMDLG